MCAQASVKKKVRVLSIITGHRVTTSGWHNYVCSSQCEKKGESSLNNNGSPCHDVGVGSGEWGGGGGALHSQASHDGKCVHSIFDRCHHHIFLDNNDHF